MYLTTIFPYNPEMTALVLFSHFYLGSPLEVHSAGQSPLQNHNVLIQKCRMKGCCKGLHATMPLFILVSFSAWFQICRGFWVAGTGLIIIAGIASIFLCCNRFAKTGFVKVILAIFLLTGEYFFFHYIGFYYPP